MKKSITKEILQRMDKRRQEKKLSDECETYLVYIVYFLQTHTTNIWIKMSIHRMSKV